jgi:hypothetical protein
MTFNDLVNEVCDRLNLTSDQAIARVGREVNSRYKRVTSSIGLATSRRVATPIPIDSIIDNHYLVFVGIEKITSVLDRSTTATIVLMERTLEEMATIPLTGGMPRNYAIYSMGAQTVTILVDSDDTDPSLLFADGLEIAETLSGSQTPAFPESFHDILIFGAVADELRKMEKQAFARDAEGDFDRRLSDLRMFIAKSAYFDLYQGKTVNATGWWKDTWTGF